MNRDSGNEPDRTRRRLLLAVLLAGTAGCAAPFAPSPRRSDAAAWFADLFGAGTGMARFGTAYLDAHPAERDPAVLFQALLDVTAGADPQRDPGATLAALERAVRWEYRTGDVVSVDGWLLSRSEARLYALATLV